MSRMAMPSGCPTPTITDHRGSNQAAISYYWDDLNATYGEKHSARSPIADILQFCLLIALVGWVIWRGIDQMDYRWQWYRVPAFFFVKLTARSFGDR